jgi:2-phosphosulfolactate phosphatase
VTVTIDCFPESVHRYGEGWTVVAVDVIRATTTAVTAVAAGRRCFPVASIEAAVPLAARLQDPLLVGELGGSVPYGFDLDNSPAELARRSDVQRSAILLSTSGTRLLCQAGRSARVYAACLRNYTAQIRHLAGRYPRIAVVGAGARGVFREEDQQCCAWIAQGLVEAGHRPDLHTANLIARWRGTPIDAWKGSDSVRYLRRTGRLQDLEFILDHVDDLDAVFWLDGMELAMDTSRPWDGALPSPLRGRR